MMSTNCIHAAKGFVAAVLLGLTLQAGAAEPAHAGVQRADAELRRVLSYELADVKSRDDLAAHLRTAGAASPLNALSTGARERFLDSLVFNDKGLVEYRFDDLQSELSVAEAYRILGLFGAAESASFLREMHPRNAVDAGIQSFMHVEDHEGGRCISPGTCEMLHPHYICTSNC
ncbi:hypothetical protein QAA18_09420 [Luteimonas sp. 8-5]|uniref:hypothetical protein n=1 Tax=Luteimonas sp. 8-5 TaxID=3039387 RepID=UPI002436DBCA|nr:hypothetical protein [Luteimonas sp. 8-5]MDG6348954.1 hypothetical protein [Luteimonas sp. 8-5]